MGTEISVGDIDDEGFERLITEINRFGDADYLILSGSALTDNGLSKITNLNGIRYLIFNGLSVTQIPDDITSIRGLKNISCTNCKSLTAIDVES